MPTVDVQHPQLPPGGVLDQLGGDELLPDYVSQPTQRLAPGRNRVFGVTTRVW